MKRHAIIPIFIPHRGCGHSCVFCNQRAITARQPDVTSADIRSILDTWLSTMQRLETIEAAFYGGSFTGLPMEEQAAFLAVLKEYKDGGLIDKIHLSTRPDYIDIPILEQLQEYGVDIIELGVQSFDPDVLKQSRRGHTPEDVFRACDLIRSFGFELGIQLMIGLPGDSYEKCMDSARKTVDIGPSLARLYPTVVLENTELARMYRRGEYTPLTTRQAVAITKDMYRILQDAGITILRVGLKSTDLITDSGVSDYENSGSGVSDRGNNEANPGGGRDLDGADHVVSDSPSACKQNRDGAVLAHSFHPAFRHLVEGELAKEDLEAQLTALLEQSASPNAGCNFPVSVGEESEDNGSQEHRSTCNFPGSAAAESEGNCSQEHRSIRFTCCSESFSNMIGHKACNKKYFSEKYPLLSFRFKVDSSIPRGEYHAELNVG